MTILMRIKSLIFAIIVAWTWIGVYVALNEFIALFLWCLFLIPAAGYVEVRIREFVLGKPQRLLF